MILYKEAATLQKHFEKIKKGGQKIGFVPTMGALHQGHISLIEKSKNNCDITICSIFVNPAQFNDPHDFEKYPVTIGTDILFLEKNGCDILFLPAVAEMYGEDKTKLRHYDLGEIEFILEGKYRPGHFQGVCQAVHRLLDIINPDILFAGQKDYQQCLVIKRLVQLTGHKTEIIVAATLREESGLAMSSRNLRLTDQQKVNATGIFRMLLYMKTNYLVVALRQLEEYVTAYLLNNGFNKVDYVSVTDAALQPVNDVTKTVKPIALIAAYIGDVRLIDNMILAT